MAAALCNTGEVRTSLLLPDSMAGSATAILPESLATLRHILCTGGTGAEQERCTRSADNDQR